MLYTEEAIKKRKGREAKAKATLNIIVYILLIPLLVYNMSLILQAVANPTKTPSFFGIKTYVIISGSMRPELEIGDIVVAREVSEEQLKVGDIICFRQGQNVITHRIEEIVRQDGQVEYITKGDNNNTEDSGTIKYNIIEGKVVNVIPSVGNIALLLQGKIAIIIIIFIFYIYIVHSGKIKKKKDLRRIKRLEYEKAKEEEIEKQNVNY